MASAAFIAGIKKRYIQPRISFIHNGTDYSPFVIKISQITRDANLSAGVANVTLNNGTGTFNFFSSTNTALAESAQVKIHLTSDSADKVTLLSGKVQNVDFQGTRVIVRVKDHLKDFHSIKLGSDTVPFDFTSQFATPEGGHPADRIVWRLLTEDAAGNLDPTEGAGNTDINWTRFVAWRDNYLDSFAQNSRFLLRARFTGETLRSALLKIAQLTHSYFWVDLDGKISFAPTHPTGQTYTASNREPLALSLSLDPIINTMRVRYRYNHINSTWLDSTLEANDATSVTQYGKRNYVEEDRTVWHHSFTSGFDDRTQTLSDIAFPKRMVSLTTNLSGVTEDVATQITVTDTIKGITAQTMTIEEIIYDLEARKVRMKAWWQW